MAFLKLPNLIYQKSADWTHDGTALFQNRPKENLVTFVEVYIAVLQRQA
jgi:hypothetical protein